MAYEPVNDKVLPVMHTHHDGKPARPGAYVYDPETYAWAEESLALPDKSRNMQVKNGPYDAELHATFLHRAGDRLDEGVTGAYRYKNER
jgi:hypothetical protein